MFVGMMSFVDRTLTMTLTIKHGSRVAVDPFNLNYLSKVKPSGKIRYGPAVKGAG